MSRLQEKKNIWSEIKTFGETVGVSVETESEGADEEDQSQRRPPRKSPVKQPTSLNCMVVTSTLARESTEWKAPHQPPKPR